MNIVLPAKARKAVYIALALAGLAAGAIPVGYQAVDAPVPHWYLAAAAVFSFVVVAPATLALLNVSDPDQMLGSGQAASDPAPVAAPPVSAGTVTADPALSEKDPGAA